MRKTLLFTALLAPLCLAACDSAAEDTPEPSKKPADLKQKPKSELSKEELAEARRKAGFKSQEEQMAEAKAVYEKMERGYVKARLEPYRDLAKQLSASIDGIEKNAKKWAAAKDPDAAFAKWNEGYKKGKKELMTEYRDLTEKESRGGDVQVILGEVITGWENLSGDLSGKVSEAEGFGPTLEALRKGLGNLETKLAEIESDESVEADELPEGAKPKKKGKKKKK